MSTSSPSRRLRRLAPLALATLSLVAAAGEDVAGAIDHPMLTRWPEAYITDYAKNYGAEEFLVAGTPGVEPERRRIEGDRTAIRYFLWGPRHAAEPTPADPQLSEGSRGHRRCGRVRAAAAGRRRR
jgi:hypothetical protein